MISEKQSKVNGPTLAYLKMSVGKNQDMHSLAQTFPEEIGYRSIS